MTIPDYLLMDAIFHANNALDYLKSMQTIKMSDDELNLSAEAALRSGRILNLLLENIEETAKRWVNNENQTN